MRKAISGEVSISFNKIASASSYKCRKKFARRLATSDKKALAHTRRYLVKHVQKALKIIKYIKKLENEKTQNSQFS